MKSFLKNSKCISFVFMVAIVGNTSCFSVKPIYYEEDKKIAQAQVEKFHQLLNEQKYDEIYDLFTDKIKNQQSKEQFVSSLKKLRFEDGMIKSSKIVKADIKIQGAFRKVHMIYETEFERQKLFEEFDCLVDSNKVLFDYYGQPEKIEVP